MAKVKSHVTFSNPDGYRFADEKGNTTAVVEANGRFTLRDAQSALEIFDSWKDWLKTMGETPTESMDEDEVLDQLSALGLGRCEPIDVDPVKSSKEKPNVMAEKDKVKEVSITKKKQEIADAKAAKNKKKPAKESKQKTPAVLSDCVCGCGEKTARTFKQGHDARVHGWFKKVERGENKLSEYPASAQKWMKEHNVAPGSRKEEKAEKAAPKAKAS